MSSIINPLFQQYNNLQLDVVVNHRVKSLFVDDKRITKVMTLRSYSAPLAINIDKLHIIAHAARHPYDILINLDMSEKAERLARLIRAKQKFGPPYQMIEHAENKHAVAILQQFYRHFLTTDALKLAYPSIHANNFADIQEKFSLTDDYVVLNTTNSTTPRVGKRNHRAWPVDYWQQLISHIAQHYPQKQIILISGPHPTEIKFVNDLELAAKSANVISVNTSVPELISLIAHAQVIVCTDTGPLHIAAAVNTPIVTLFGPSDKNNTGPFVPANAKHVKVLHSDIACSPCQKTPRYNECLKNQCMLDLTPEYVFNTIDALINHA